MNAGQVSRFAAPLAYNFLHVIRMHERLPKGEVRRASATACIGAVPRLHVRRVESEGCF